MPGNLEDLLPPIYHGLEWYDNSTLSTVDRCKRKGFWKNIFTLPSVSGDSGEKPEFKGIAEKVSNGALYGSAMHNALDRFYSPINIHRTYEQRRISAFRGFSSKYAELIPNPEEVDNKHSHDRGLDILDMYIDHYQEQDQHFKVLDTEVVMINVIKPRPEDNENHFTPFIYIARSDGLVLRLLDDVIYVLEHKNVVSVEQEMNKLRIGRQGEGYVWSAKEFPTLSDLPVKGLLANILAVRAAEVDPAKLFFREWIPISTFRTEQWRIETIRKVEHWRSLVKEAKEQPAVMAAMLTFDRTTEECTRYGLCSYFDLCLHGPHSVDLSKYTPNNWNPLYTEKVENE